MHARQMLCLGYSNLQEGRNISKLCMIAIGHWFPVYDLGNECASVFSAREKCSSRSIIALEKSIWMTYKPDVGNFFADGIMLFFNIRRQLPLANVN